MLNIYPKIKKDCVFAIRTNQSQIYLCTVHPALVNMFDFLTMFVGWPKLIEGSYWWFTELP